MNEIAIFYGRWLEGGTWKLSFRPVGCHMPEMLVDMVVALGRGQHVQAAYLSEQVSQPGSPPSLPMKVRHTGVIRPV